MRQVLLLALMITLGAACTSARNKQDDESPSSDYLSKDWKYVATRMPSEWYDSEEAKWVADSVLKYQTEIGGWAKNTQFHNGGVDQEVWAKIQKTGIGATFDNDATLTEMMFLAKIYAKQKDESYREVFMKACDYIFEAQYANGGWPQFFPYQKGNSAYSSHITYNDDAMVNIMNFLADIIDGNKRYAAMQISDEMKVRAEYAFDKGIDCIIRTQIIRNGKPTVWCAQHDEFTFAPAKARSYELESFSGAESAGITLLLMDIDSPTVEIIAAVNGAVEWFENNRVKGIWVKDFINEEGLEDRIVVEDIDAPDLWARFYDLETVKPFFCDRDGIKKNSLAEIGLDRRSNYNWYTDKPQKVIEKYPEWKAKL